MQGGFYQEVFGKFGMSVSVPQPKEQNYIHEKYVGELVSGVFLPETRASMLGIASAMKERDIIEGLILGGTELPLLFRDEAALGLPLLDTTRIHVNAALERILS
jgi:aspartate racemase